MADLAREAAGDAANIFVLDSHDDTNTYAIGRRVQAGLVWTSTLGPDMVTRGKPVLVAARAPYLVLGVGEGAASQEEYFAKLLEISRDPRPPSPEQVTASKQYQWILYHDLSLPGAPALSLDPPGAVSECRRFHRILAGELDPKGRPLPSALGEEPGLPLDAR